MLRRNKQPEAKAFEYEFHPLAETYPLMEGKDFDELVEDIRQHGVRERIALADGKIADGRNRYRAAKAAGYQFVEDDFYTVDHAVDLPALILSLNYHRRHLTNEQKREVIADKILANPDASSRQIAEEVKASHNTVEKVRRGLVATGQVDQLDKRTGQGGKARTTSPTRQSAPKPKSLSGKFRWDYKAFGA